MNLTPEIYGGSRHGASTISANDGSREPSENALAIARFPDKHVPQIAKLWWRGGRASLWH
jgi:hypothetical protein